MNANELRRIAEDVEKNREAERRRAEETQVAWQREADWARAKQVVRELSGKLEDAARHGVRTEDVFAVYSDGAMWEYRDVRTVWDRFWDGLQKDQKDEIVLRPDRVVDQFGVGMKLQMSLAQEEQHGRGRKI